MKQKLPDYYFSHICKTDITQDHSNSPPDKDHMPRSGSSGKGVQYPFSVNERVMIKVCYFHPTP